jgi:diacylglycerol O-acyltransferase
MQLGAVLVFDAGPLQLRHGGIDVERLRAYTAKRLSEVPRTRERRIRLALGALEVFGEDPSFQLDYHVRHVSLPRPGDERALKRLAGRVFSQELDPGKPLWELWIVEGLEAARFALLAKCDAALLEPSARTSGTLARAGELLVRRAVSLAQPSALLARVAGGVRFALDFAEGALAGADAPLGNASVGAHRRIEWLALAAPDVAAICARLGGTERDVVLTALAGGLRRVFERRVARADLGALRIVTPICVGEQGASPRFRLPIEVADARARFVAVRSAGERHARSASGKGVSPLHELAALAVAALAGRRADLAAFELATPPGPAELLGARLEAFVPVAPRLPGHALGVTMTRHLERLFIGLSADAARLPDLAALTDAIAASFDELRRLAAQPVQKAAATRVKRPRRGRSPEKHVELETR